MTGFGGSTYTPAVDLAGLFSNDRAWKHLADPYDNGGSSTDVDYDAGSGASMAPSRANALAGYFPGIPIGIVPAARGSSPLDCTVDPLLCWASRNAAEHVLSGPFSLRFRHFSPVGNRWTTGLGTRGMSGDHR